MAFEVEIMGQIVTQAIRGQNVFDRAFFEHCTMHDQQLMSEVIGLFRAQVETLTVGMVDITSKTEWKFQAHCLKGAAAAVGATEIEIIAASWEILAFPKRYSEREALRETLDIALRTYLAEASKLVVAPVLPTAPSHKM
jgi:HPt (histidine-containing phosphotransfer) domain-containing protein